MQKYSMLRLNNISLRFQQKKIFSQLSLQIDQGDKVLLEGRSGIGKSTIFSLIQGFVEPQNGDIYFNNLKIDKKNIWKIRKHIDMKVSDWLDQIFNFKANCSKGIDQEKIDLLFKYFKLNNDLLHIDTSELSGGEKQRLSIIISILLQRKLYLLDEVTSALDKDLKKIAADMFMKSNDWTVLIISHDPVWYNYSNIKIFDLETKQWKQ